MLHKWRLLTFLTCIFITCTSLAESAPTDNLTLKIGYDEWPGLAPMIVAQHEAYFQAEKLNVIIVQQIEPKDLFTGFNSGKFNAVITSLDTVPLYWQAKNPSKVVAILDTSAGYDGILAQSAFTTITELKGKRIGVSSASPNLQMYLDYVLKQAGFLDRDFKLIDIRPEKIVAALKANKIDAGVTQQPFLDQGVKTGAIVLATSKQTPGVMFDALVLSNKFLGDNPETVKRFMRAWDAALAYMSTHPNESKAIIKNYLSKNNFSYSFNNESAKYLQFYTLATNQQMFTGYGDGSARGIMQAVLDFLNQHGFIDQSEHPYSFIDGTYLQVSIAK